MLVEILFWRLLGFRVSPKAKKEGKIIEKREREASFLRFSFLLKRKRQEKAESVRRQSNRVERHSVVHPCLKQETGLLRSLKAQT